MKKIILFIVALLPLSVFAQENTEGRILYKETIQLKIELPKEHQHLASMLPGSQSSEMELLFNKETALYKSFEKDQEEDDDMMAEEGNVRIKMVVSSDDSQVYRNLKSGDQIEKKDFMGKKFIITGTTEKLAWKLTGKQETILDHVCQQAVFQDSTHHIIAWFAPQIPVSIGPDVYGDLPGMILKIESGKDGERTIEATSIEWKKIDNDLIKKPKKGKAVTYEEYEKIVEAKTKEMESQGGNTVIRMRMN